MFVALYGRIASHSWPRVHPDQDPFSLFVVRSEGMGWVGQDLGLWGMNDAGSAHLLEGRHEDSPLAWFQVETSPVAPTDPLPVQPFLHCATDVVQRFGRLHLDRVLLLLPTQRLGGRSGMPIASMRTYRWFGDSDPAARVNVEVSLTVGQRASKGVLESTLGHFSELDTHVFLNAVRSWANGENQEPPCGESLWGGPATSTETLVGDLIEWEPDSIGWLAQTLADCAAKSGLASPVLISVAKTREAEGADLAPPGSPPQMGVPDGH